MRALLISLTILIMLAGMSAWIAWSLLHQPVRFADDERVLDVRAGDSLHSVLRALEAEGALRSTRETLWVARATGRNLGIRAGEYSIRSGTSVSNLINQLVQGNAILHALTIVEGWTFSQLRRTLAEHPALEQTLAGMSDEGVMVALGRPGIYPEGLFFPDTYLFSRGVTDLAFLERSMRVMDARLATAWARRDGGLPYDTPYDALIMASIIEREAKVQSEQTTIAGVFIRRLQLGMRLQTDPTVMYGVGPDFTGRLRTVHLRTDTPYNTYTRHGLPPTPIAMPGKGALEAAMHPEPGEVLYFVARGDGSHHFSVTLTEHNRAVARYQLGRQDDGN